jgi:hypothetical protein
MTSASGSTERAAPADQTPVAWTTGALFARHKRLGVSAVALLVLLLAIVVGGLLASSPAVVNDSSTCSTWSSANQSAQQAYAARYVREHGPLANGATAPATVVAAINAGCTEAFDNDVQDNVTLVHAIQP